MLQIQGTRVRDNKKVKGLEHMLSAGNSQSYTSRLESEIHKPELRA